MKLLSGVLISSCYGHGRLMNPPSRSSLWRLSNDDAVIPFQNKIVPNYQDHELFCGGFAKQVENGYKCGVCGDNYADARPRANELGGKYGSHSIIPRTYSSGELVDVEVQITAHHKGFFQFKLCEINSTMTTEEEACFDAEDSIVPFSDGSTEYSITNEFPESSGRSDYWYSMKIQLPDKLECDHCVLQWRYHTGNSWGTDENGIGGIGLGEQEEFYGCADIEIVSTDESGLPPQLTTNEPSGTAVVQQSTTTNKPTGTTPSPAKPTTSKTNLHQETFCSDKDDILYSHDKDCSMYYHCSHGETYEMNCPLGPHGMNLFFNQDKQTCDYQSNVNCTLFEDPI